MWMQIFKAAGYAVHGEAFPRDWGRTIREANRAGFYESGLRTGIYFATNPNPKSGGYLSPHETRELVVKVFASGLVRSDLAFVDKVVLSMRSVREYRASLERLYALERESKRAIMEREGPPVDDALFAIERIPPGLEWWHDNYTSICDAQTRGYPLRMVSYAAVLAEPERWVRAVLAWVGGGDVACAASKVEASMRTQRGEGAEGGASGLAPPVEALCDELYQRVHEQRPLDAAFMARLSSTHEELTPLIREARARQRVSRRRVKALRAARRRALAAGSS